MSAHVAPVAQGVQIAPSSSQTFRSQLEAHQKAGRRMSLDDAIAVLVPVCMDLKERHDRGETLFVHASAIAKSPDGLMRLHPALAIPPTMARDRAALAPELQQSGGAGGARASVFAIGAMLYEAVTGGAVGPAMRRPQDVDPTLPDALELLLSKALVANASARPDDLGALASAMHHLAPMKSIHPPDVDVSRLDSHDDFQVDVKMSLLPPRESLAPGVDVKISMGPPQAPEIIMPKGIPDAPPSAPGSARATNPTAQLANLKARLESDLRPRYVVNKDRMDHGPFSAVELLQQVASHHFKGDDILRDELSGISQKIDDWEEFAPFAQHARMHREIKEEKIEVARVEKAEKKAGVAKFAISGVVALALLVGGVAFVVKKVGERKDGADLTDDQGAVDLSTGGALKGNKKAGAGKAGGGGGGGAGGGGGGFVGGGSYEAALAANNQEINLNGPKIPDLTDGQLGAPMRNAAFISGCGAPDNMKVTVRVAVKMGRAVGVSVYTTPPNPGVSSCIDRHVRGLSWPANGKMDFFTTTY